MLRPIMSLYALPVLFTLFVWWFSTGVILFLDGLPQAHVPLEHARRDDPARLGPLRIVSHAADTSVSGAYAAFACGVLVWGWQEMSFLMGFVTGPRRTPCPSGCGGWPHFGHAIETVLYHELALIASATAVIAVTWGGPNQVGTWTFLVLWAMRQSAKLNVFLGVRNLSEEFLPGSLALPRKLL